MTLPNNEADQGGERLPRENVLLQYLGSAANVRLRFNLYNYADDGISVDNVVVDHLAELQGDETVVDFGCADGNLLMKLREKNGHFGRLLGIDIDDYSTVAVERAANMHIEPPEFIIGDCADTGLDDNSADAVTAMFVLYHTENPDEAVAEAARILKPEGQLIVATSGRANKTKHREFEKQTADYLGIKRPPIFSASFDDQQALAVLPKHVEILEHFVQRTEMTITEDNIDEYLLSLYTMMSACDPIPHSGEWVGAINEIVVPQITSDIRVHGAFKDTIDRHILFAKK